MLKFSAVFKGYVELHEVLDSIPDRVQTRIFRLAGRKASKAVADKATANTPRRKKDGKDGLGHLQDRFGYVQRVYRKEGKTVFVVGSKSGKKNRINHIVERGTVQRFTGHVTGHRTIPNPGNTTHKRRIKTATGAWKTITVTARKRGTRISTGSLRKVNADGSLAAMSSRGTMPAYRQLQRAVESVDVDAIVAEQVRGGLQRILDRS